MHRHATLTLLVGLLGLTGVHAQDAVTIKLKTRGVGTSLMTKDVAITTKTKVEDDKGNVVANKTDEKKESASYRETVLAQDGDKLPTKLERTYTKCEVVSNGEKEAVDLPGKTVVVEKKGDKYVFTYKDGATVVGKAAEFLAKEFNDKTDVPNSEKDKLLLPTGAVKPGATWKLDMPPIIAAAFKGSGLEFDDAKATGAGKLVKTYQKDGMLFGELAFQMALPMKAAGGKGAERLVFKEGANTAVEVKMDVCIDGTAEVGTINVRVVTLGTTSVGDAIVHLDILHTNSGTRTELKK